MPDFPDDPTDGPSSDCLDEFLEAREIRRFNRPTRRSGPGALRVFWEAATAEGRRFDELSLAEARKALSSAAVGLTLAERRQWPELCAAFLRWCADAGYCPAGRDHARRLAGQTLDHLPSPPDAPPPTAPAPAPAAATAPPADPERRPGPNAPCPCVSGKKAKRCCFRYN